MIENISLSPEIRLLITDDDIDDRMLIKDALEENEWSGSHQYFNDGQELIDYLNTRISKVPTIILLDLNMPRKNGWETLHEIRANKDLQHIPVLIFTTSSANEDIHEAYKIGGNTFFTKPALFSDLVNTVKDIKDYWSTRACIPLAV